MIEMIENFGLMKQKRAISCGYATAGMILTFLEGQSIDEDFLWENDPIDATGITFRRLMEVYSKYLKQHRAEIVYGDQRKMLEIIQTSIEANLPLHILYLTPNRMSKNEPVLHYAALIGYHREEGSFVLADPYGMVKLVEKEEFFDAISFRNECLPEIIKENYPSNMMIRFISL